MPLPSFLSSSAVPYPPEAGAHQLKSHQTKALSVPLAARHPQESPLPPVSVMPKPKQKASARSSSERETGRNSRGCRTAPRPHTRVLARHMRQSPFGKDGRPWTRTIPQSPDNARGWDQEGNPPSCDAGSPGKDVARLGRRARDVLTRRSRIMGGRFSSSTARRRGCFREIKVRIDSAPLSHILHLTEAQSLVHAS